MDDVHIEYVCLPDVTPESEAEVLSSVYAFLIERAQARKAAEAGGGEDAVEGATTSVD